MARTIPKEQQAKRPRCPQCGLVLQRESILGDQREGSMTQEAFVCANGHRTEGDTSDLWE